jgi:hypothetical protein
MQVEQGQKIDRLELAIQGRRAANLCPDSQVRTQEFRYLRRFCSQLFQRTVESRQCSCPMFEGGEMATTKVSVSRCPYRWVLGGEGTATEQVSATVLLGVISNAFPEQA